MKTVLITGGSSGIGLEFSKLFAKDDYRIIIVSKYDDEMNEAAAILKKSYPKVELILFQKDLSTFNAAQSVYDFVKKNAYEIDVLVNNAGFGCFGFVDDINAQKEQDMIQLNVACVHQMTRLFLKDMVAKKLKNSYDKEIRYP